MIEAFKLIGKIALEGGEKIAKDLKGVEGKLSKFSGNLKKAGKATRNLGMKMAPVSGVAIGVGGAMFKVGNETAEVADRIDKMSQKIGMSRSGFQEWEFILSQSGASIEGMQQGMKTLTQRMDESISGTGKGAEAFKELGINITESMSQEEAFEASVRALQEMEDGAEKAKIANELFGRSGQELMPLLNGTTDSLDDMKKTYEDLGLEISDETIDAGVKWTDTMDQLKRVGSTLGAELGGAVLPILQQFGDYMINEGVPKIKGFIDKIKEVIQWFTDLSPTTKKIILGIGGFIAIIAPLLLAIGTFLSIGGMMVGQIITLINVVKKIRTAMMLLNATMWLSPVTWIIAGIIALVAIGVLLYKNWDTIKVKLAEAWDLIKTKATEVFGSLKEWLSQTWTNIKTKVVETVSGLVTGAVNKFNELKNGIINKIKQAKTDAIQKALEIKNGITDKFEEAKRNAERKFNELKEKILSPIEKAKETISGIVDDIKGFFSGMKLSIPKIKLPSLPKPKITGSFSLSPPSVPKISWNAKGGYFDEATVLQGLGEQGKEVILPIEHRRHMAPFAQAIADNLGATGTDSNRITVEVPVNLNGREIARVITKDIDRELERRRTIKERGGRR